MIPISLKTRLKFSHLKKSFPDCPSSSFPPSSYDYCSISLLPCLLTLLGRITFICCLHLLTCHSLLKLWQAKFHPWNVIKTTLKKTHYSKSNGQFSVSLLHNLSAAFKHLIASSLNPFFTLFLRFPIYSLGKGRICILSVSFAHFSCQFLNTGRPEFKFWAVFPTLAYLSPFADLTSSFRYLDNSGLFSLQIRPLPEHRTAFSTFPLG